jgi:predicted secreted protein
MSLSVRSRTRAAVLALSTLAAAVHAQSPIVTAAPPQNVVMLSATATVEVPKDLLTVVFSTTREGADAALVQSQLKQALDTALAEARKAAKPGQVDVQTGNFSLYPRYTPKGGTNGWQGTAELVVEGRDMPAISQLAGRIQTLTIARTSFGLSREAREKVDADVTAQAIARFKARAEQVARQFGFAGWGLREVTVQGTDLPSGPPVMRAQAMRAAGAADESLPVEAGKTSVTATVSGSVQLSAR